MKIISAIYDKISFYLVCKLEWIHGFMEELDKPTIVIDDDFEYSHCYNPNQCSFDIEYDFFEECE